MEIFDVCDEKGRPTGQTVSREQAHREGILHRTAHVWVLQKKQGRYEVLLQKRSPEKDSFPGMYDTSSAGHIPAGSEPLESAIRELYEELGIDAAPSDLKFAGTFRIRYEREFHGKIFRDNEFSSVYVYTKDVDIDRLRLQESEVSEVRWFPLSEVQSEIRLRRTRFCVPTEGLNVLVRYLESHGAVLERFEMSCGAVVFTECEGQRKYLLIREISGAWGFPKGHMEKDENEIETAAREIREETGLVPRFIEGFQCKSEYYLPGRVPAVRKNVIYFLAEYEDQTYRPQEEEITEIALMDFSEALSVLPFEASRRILQEAEAFLRKNREGRGIQDES